MLSRLFARTLRLDGRPLADALATGPAAPVTTATGCTTRGVHSATQRKRLFQRHPARARVEARLGQAPEPAPLPAPRFPDVFQPTFLSNGWSAPPPPAEQAAALAQYPFAVARTRNKPMDAIGFLPVYAQFRKDGTKAVTRIRKVTGDRETFLQELCGTLQVPPAQIRIRTGGTVEVPGNRVRDVKRWLAGLGF